MRAIVPELILSIALIADAFAQTADLAVTNARIYTVNPKQPMASAIAVRQGKILAVGDDLSRYVGTSTQVIDAGGATIIPGLIDSHGHMRDLGEMLAGVYS
jgi:predicted amidohydrolase YtcJ